MARSIAPALAAVAALALETAAPSVAATADPSTDRIGAPCAGCRLRVPAAARGHAAPLVVALHGEPDNAWAMSLALGAATDERGAILASLQCPRDLGCTGGSWGRWRAGPRHDDAWLDVQLDAIARAVPVDASRVYAVGYSGGANYLAAWLPAHPGRFAAVALASGGAALGPACEPPPTPAYLLIGAFDPLTRPGIEALRDRLGACDRADFAFVLRNVDHAGMLDAIRAREAARMLDWLLERSRAADGAAP